MRIIALRMVCIAVNLPHSGRLAAQTKQGQTSFCRVFALQAAFEVQAKRCVLLYYDVASSTSTLVLSRTRKQEVSSSHSLDFDAKSVRSPVPGLAFSQTNAGKSLEREIYKRTSSTVAHQ